MYSRVISMTAGLVLIATTAFAGQNNNLPWYPSLMAFEHYDSGRSHVFSHARFRGTFHGSNTVDIIASNEGQYPSGYNMSYLNAEDAFIQGGSYGDVPGSIGPFVAKVDPKTLAPLWTNQLVNTVETGEWDYPGGMAILTNGYIYVVSGYRIFKLDPADGHTVAETNLPTLVYMRSNYPTNPPTYDDFLTDYRTNTSYNGINALPDGTIVVKSLYRAADCTNYNGPSALINCPDVRNVPQSVLITVNPDTLGFIDNITLPAPAAARPTITQYKGTNYVYLVENTSNAVRYKVTKGFFQLDTNWIPAAITNSGQTPGGSLIVMNDWVLGANNSIPATGALTMYAINQNDATKVFTLQPYVHDPTLPVLAQVFAPAVSWAGMSLEADPENGIFYGVETLKRKVAAYKLTDSGIVTVWKKTQTTTEWATLIGPKGHRVWVGTDIPETQIPGENTSDMVVWRDAATGEELARSEEVPYMTQGSAVAPGYEGSIYFPGAEGQLFRMTPRPARATGKSK